MLHVLLLLSGYDDEGYGISVGMMSLNQKTKDVLKDGVRPSTVMEQAKAMNDEKLVGAIGCVLTNKGCPSVKAEKDDLNRRIVEFCKSKLSDPSTSLHDNRQYLRLLGKATIWHFENR